MFSRVFDRVLIVSAALGAFIVAFLWLSINYEVFMRYLLNSPTRWVSDFAGFFVIYITFLGAAWLLAREGHVKIELVLDVLPPRAKRTLNIITSIAGALICGLLFWYSLQMTLVAFQEAQHYDITIIVPRWPVFMVIPFGSLLLTLQFLRRAWGYARESKVPEKMPEEVIASV